MATQGHFCPPESTPDKDKSPCQEGFYVVSEPYIVVSERGLQLPRLLHSPTAQERSDCGVAGTDCRRRACRRRLKTGPMRRCGLIFERSRQGYFKLERRRLDECPVGVCHRGIHLLV